MFRTPSFIWSLAAVLVVGTAQAQETPGRRPTPTAAIAAAGPSEGRDLTVRRSGAERGEPTGSVGTPSWWLVAAGIGVALVGLGAASLGAGRWARLPGRSAGDLRVVGRLHLTTRHSIHLLRVGDRTLLVGTGQGGAPALLGELVDPPAGSPMFLGPDHRTIRMPSGRGGAA